MRLHVIKADSILNWDAFHNVFQAEFGFPAYYGRNMDAWNDCMSDACHSGGAVSLRIDDAHILKDKAPDILDALVECSAFINWRCTKDGADPLIALSLYV